MLTGRTSRDVPGKVADENSVGGGKRSEEWVSAWGNVWVSGDRNGERNVIRPDITDLAGRMGTEMKIGRIMYSSEKEEYGDEIYFVDVATVLYMVFHLPVTTLKTFLLQTKTRKTQTPCNDLGLVNAASCDLNYLAHEQDVSVNNPTRTRLKSKVEDLKVPRNTHAKEEADVDQHLVPLDANPAAAGAVRARTTKMLIVSGLANVDHSVDEHAGVDEQENKDWKVEPEKFA